MRHSKRLVVVLVSAALTLAAVLAGLSLSSDPGTAAESAGGSEPAHVEEVEGSALSRVILSEKAAERLDIQTEAVRNEQIGGAPRKVIPYGAVLYDAHGKTWAYTNPEPLTFVRAEIVVDRIEGDHAFLTEGPDAGTAIVKVGVAELFGTEYGVGH